MRVTSVELHPARSTTVVVLSYRDPTRGNPYNVKEIDGLDADGIVAKFYGVSANSNEQFYNLSQDKRDIIVRIGLKPVFANQSYSDLRDALYKMIASSRTGLIQLQFKNETGVVAVISGWVQKFEAPQFAKEPVVNITIKTDDPMLKAPDPVNVNVAGLDPADTLISDLVSTAPHGLDFQMTFSAATATLAITDPLDPSWSFGVTPAGGFLAGDVLHFSSDPKNKALYIVRGIATIYLADVLTPGSIWPVIFPGDNHLAFATPANMHWTAISYYPTFWGV